MALALPAVLRTPLARGLLVYVLVPNLAFYLLGREVYMHRVLVNTDYLLLWLASCYLPRRATIALYALLVDLDLVLSTESIYHFSTMETMVMARELFDHQPLEFYSIVGALLALVVAAVAFGWRARVSRPPLSRRAQLAVGLVALALSGASLARSLKSLEDPLVGPAPLTVVGSSIVETGVSSADIALSVQDAKKLSSASGSTSSLLREVSAAGPKAREDIVLVLVESQGLLKDGDDMRAVFAPLLQPAVQARYRVKLGAVRFYGATMFGELRSLCRIYMPSATPRDLPGLDRCLPNRLDKLGYETVSYHGYWRWFYERKDWYPRVGFQHMHFAEDLLPQAPASAKCGSGFQGLCDTWIAGRVREELLSARTGKFVYWLTLNSHLPVDTELARDSDFDCARTRSLAALPAPCALSRIHARLYERIAALVLDPRLPPTRFIIVGDHMPPFATLAERAIYDDARVPFLELRPAASGAR